MIDGETSDACVCVCVVVCAYVFRLEEAELAEAGNDDDEK